MELNFTVTDQSLILTTDIRDLVITSDSINNVQCKFTFNNAWDDCMKRVYFKNSSYNILKPVLLNTDNTCLIPWECLAHTGVITCAVVGSRFNDGSLVFRLTTDTVPMLLQREESILQSTFEPTGTEFEQLLATLLDYSDILIDLDNEIKDIRTYIDLTISEFEAQVQIVEEAVQNAIQAASDASESEIRAADSASDAQSSADVALTAAQDATLASQSAQDSKEAAENAQEVVEAAQEEVEDIRDDIVAIAATLPTNLRNGSADSSLRQISSAEEDANYTMGLNAFAEGLSTKAPGTASHAEGSSTVASGYYSHAEGFRSQASGASAHAEGSGTVADSPGSHAEGHETRTNADYSHAEGEGTIASCRAQHVEGEYNIEDIAHKYAHIIGNGVRNGDVITRSNAYTVDWQGNVEAAGDITDGDGNELADVASKLINNFKDGSAVGSVRGINTAVEDPSYTMGRNAFAEGFNTKASGYHTHAEGYESNATVMGAHAEGYKTNANAECSHSEGYMTTTSGRESHAEGHSSVASGEFSHAEGASTTASNSYSHAEGQQTQATGQASHSEGFKTVASALQSHAEGNNTTASGQQSHASGISTIAQRKAQTVIGRYNEPDEDGRYAYAYGKYAFIVGNGESDAPSNGFTVDWDGNIEAAGEVKGANIPSIPTVDGVYVLQVIISNGVPTYSWVNN